MKRILLAPLSALLLAPAVTPPASLLAQTVTTCTVSGTSGKCSPDVSLDKPGTITNPALLQLTLSSTSFSATATASDMGVSQGMTTGGTVTITVQANRAWTVQAQGNSAVWTASAGAWASKPVSDLHWSLTPTGASTAMSQTSATILSGSAGAGTPTTIYMRPVVNWTTDKPGVYTLGVTFTLTTP
jgi:hypothetical protein